MFQNNLETETTADARFEDAQQTTINNRRSTIVQEPKEVPRRSQKQELWPTTWGSTLRLARAHSAIVPDSCSLFFFFGFWCTVSWLLLCSTHSMFAERGKSSDFSLSDVRLLCCCGRTSFRARPRKLRSRHEEFPPWICMEYVGSVCILDFFHIYQTGVNLAVFDARIGIPVWLTYEVFMVCFDEMRNWIQSYHSVYFTVVWCLICL